MKYNTDGSVNRYKARLVVKGYAQKHDVDYNETFAPFAKMTTVCVLLVVLVAKGWHLRSYKEILRNKCTWYNPPDCGTKYFSSLPTEEVTLRT